jgi:ketosteroid isomerase-like protein
MSDVDNLKTTFEQMVAAIDRRDAKAYAAFWHDQIVSFPPLSPFAMDGSATMRQLVEGYFSSVESESFAPIAPQYRVAASTGIVWGHAATTLKPKDGPLRTFFVRFTFTFTKTEDRWRLLLIHVSLMPAGG